MDMRRLRMMTAAHKIFVALILLGLVAGGMKLAREDPMADDRW